MLSVYTKYIETQLREAEANAVRPPLYAPPPPKERGLFETFLYGKKNKELERSKQALKEQLNNLATSDRRERITELRQEIQQLSSAHTWTQHDVEIRIRKLRHETEAREKLLRHKDQLRNQAGGLLGAVLDIGADILVDKAGAGSLLDDAIWELEEFKKSRPLQKWDGEKPKDEAETIKDRLKKYTKSIDELWQAEEELFKEYSQKYDPKKARELVDDAMRRLRQERRV